MEQEQAASPAALTSEHAKFNDIYARYAKLVHAYCARRTDSSQAADAVAETFLVAWRRLDQIEVDTALPWLYGTAHRILSHQWRSRNRAQRLIGRLIEGDQRLDGPEVVVMRQQERDLVLLAASRLRPVDQEILRLTVWEELSLADVAQALSLAPAAVKQRAYRARRNLTAEYNRLAGVDRRSRAGKEGNP
ncbi:MAG TPA: sigma-70 family RNA polymerase sigma factor [Acidimicrobiia bacterium]|nr:sigma-70 family RNA polymerase sigma factor [Acidimicrobiia bacterium]